MLNLKCYYLKQFTLGRFREIVSSCQHLSDGVDYKHARKLLDQKYGDKYTIATYALNRVLNRNSIWPEDSNRLEKLSIELTSCKTIINSLGYLNSLNNNDTLLRIVHKLPYNLQESWRRQANIDHLTNMNKNKENGLSKRQRRRQRAHGPAQDASRWGSGGS